MSTSKMRVKHIHQRYRSDNIYANALFAALAVMAFVIVDLYCLKAVWNLVQTEDALFVWLVAFACAAALDIPMAVAANAQKKYDMKLCSRNEYRLIMILSIAVFAIAFVFSFAFRIITRDLSFDIGMSTMVNTVNEINESTSGHIAILIASIFNGVIPLLTSLASFVVSYVAYDPLAVRLQRLEKQRVNVQSALTTARKSLIEAETSSQHCERLMQREEDLYQEFLRELDVEGLSMKQKVRVLLMERLGTPEDITAMTRSGQKVMNSYEVTTEPERHLTTFVQSQIQDRKGSSGYAEVA